MLFNLDSNSITITHIGSVFLYYLYSIRAQYISYTRTKIIGSPITYQDFLAAQEAEAHPTDLVQLSALQTLFSDPSANVSQIAQQAAAPILKALDETPGVPVYTSLFWRAVAAAVRDLPQYNDKLVEFVVEFQKVPSPDDYISYMTDFMRHWTEFEFHYKDDIATNAASQQQWINISIFSAKLAATKVPQLNELSRGGYVLRTLLENTPEDINELRGTVPAAAVWINLNGKTIYESKGKMEGEYDWITSEWKGEKGWSKERWTFWKERFATISTEEALDKETREIAKNAAELMGKIEAEN